MAPHGTTICTGMGLTFNLNRIIKFSLSWKAKSTIRRSKYAGESATVLNFPTAVPKLNEEAINIAHVTYYKQLDSPELPKTLISFKTQIVKINMY